MTAPNNNVNPSRVVDLQTGKKTKPWIVSQSFGRYREPLIQTASITREMTVDMIPEFDNVNMAASVRTYNGTKASFEYVSSQNTNIESMVMNTNPLLPIVMFDPAQTAQVDVFWTDKGINSGTSYASRALFGGKMEANTISEDTKSAMKKTMGFSFIQEKEIINGQIQYTRFTQATVAFVTADDVSFSAGAGTFPTTAKAMTNTDGTTIFAMWVKFNGIPVTDTTQYTITATTFTPTTLPVSGDVWEVFTVIPAA
jgi:hypothetical protein